MAGSEAIKYLADCLSHVQPVRIEGEFYLPTTVTEAVMLQVLRECEE